MVFVIVWHPDGLDDALSIELLETPPSLRPEVALLQRTGRHAEDGRHGGGVDEHQVQVGRGQLLQ